jgi:hypothetical protein
MERSDFIISKLMKHPSEARWLSKIYNEREISRPSAFTNHLFPARNRDAALVESADTKNFLLFDVRAIIEPCRFRT